MQPLDLMMEYELPLFMVNGHVFTKIAGKQLLVDTGSPFSAMRDESPHMKQLWNLVSTHISPDVDGLLGMDILRSFDCHFRLADGCLGLFRAGSRCFDDQGVAVCGTSGIPILAGLSAAGSRGSAYFDTGAQITYLADAIDLSNYQLVGTRTDFHPCSTPDEFEVEIRKVPVSWNGIESPVQVEAALLPRHLRMPEMRSILGSEVLAFFDVVLSMTNSRIEFSRH